MEQSSPNDTLIVVGVAGLAICIAGWVIGQTTIQLPPTDHPVAVELDGQPYGTAGTQSIVSGRGVTPIVVDTGRAVQIQYDANTAVMQTIAGAQAGTVLYCESHGASPSTYTCDLLPSIQALTKGMVLHWVPDVNGGILPTLNVDALGDKPLFLPENAIAGQMYAIWFNGAEWRKVQ